MTTYGPFYPSALANESQGGGPWSISGGGASAHVSGEGATDFLVATGFGANVPAGKVIVEARLAPAPDPSQHGFNNSDQYIVGPLGEQQAYAAPPVVRVEADDVDGLTADVVNDSTFGFKFALYTSHGGIISITSLALYIDAE